MREVAMAPQRDARCAVSVALDSASVEAADVADL
jgi:hypothetical protein